MNHSDFRINGDRLKESLKKYAKIGGTESNGVTRLALSKEDIQARSLFEKECKDMGLDVVYDDLGNMYATLVGSNSDALPVVMGSHLDTVIKGGRFDGALGVLAGLEVIKTFLDYKIQPLTSIIVMNITNEEGARFGPTMMSSGVLSRRFDKDKILQSKDEGGITFGKALAESGYEGREMNRILQAKAFLELHIEQGPVLEKKKIDIGIVKGIIGMINYEVEVKGISNHAGTTPMPLRKDAFFAACDFIQELRKKLIKLDNDLVYTIGQFNMEPNVHTIIPDKVVFSIEARHKDEHTIQEMENIMAKLASGSEEGGNKIKLTKRWERETAWFNKRIVNYMEDSCKNLNFSFEPMISGAGHDSQFISSYIPTAMIFVPSIDGKSHSEDENTYWMDCERGANVLLQTILKLLKN